MSMSGSNRINLHGEKLKFSIFSIFFMSRLFSKVTSEHQERHRCNAVLFPGIIEHHTRVFAHHKFHI